MSVCDPTTNEPAADVPVIAIDGPAASGKGTIAQGVAAALGYRYLDSGSLYRLVALQAFGKRCLSMTSRGSPRLPTDSI